MTLPFAPGDGPGGTSIGQGPSTPPPPPSGGIPTILPQPGGEEAPSGPSIPAPVGENIPIGQVQGTQDFRVDLRNYLESFYERLEEELGLSKFTIGTFVEQNWEYVVNQMEWATDEDILDWLDGGKADLLRANDEDPTLFLQQQAFINGKLNPNSLAGLNTLQGWATQIMDSMLGINSAELFNARSSGGGGSVRRSGPTKPTPEQLRNQFDKDALARNINDMWRAYMAEEAPDAKGLASAYVEEIVRTGGEKQIDFQAFVLRNMEGTSRWKTLYKHKPKGVDPLRHMAPYIAATQQAIGSAAENNRFGQLVLEGAGLGASVSDFAGKLMREDPVQESSQFISGLEQTVASVKGILRG